MITNTKHKQTKQRHQNIDNNNSTIKNTKTKYIHTQPTNTKTETQFITQNKHTTHKQHNIKQNNKHTHIILII